MTDFKMTPEQEAQADAIIARLTANQSNRIDPFTSDPDMTAHMLAVLALEAGGEVVFTQERMNSADGAAMQLEFVDAADGKAAKVVCKKKGS